MKAILKKEKAKKDAEKKAAKEAAEKDASANTVRVDPVKEFQPDVDKSMKDLIKLYTQYQNRSSDQTPLPEDNMLLFTEWALHYTEYCEKMESGEHFPEVRWDNKDCFKANSRAQFFRCFWPNFFGREWPIRFTGLAYIRLLFLTF